MARKRTNSAFNYSLRIRTFTNDGKPHEWRNYGQGVFTDIETVQKQIRLLKAGIPNHTVEVEFIWDGILRDYNGNPSEKNIMFERRP